MRAILIKPLPGKTGVPGDLFSLLKIYEFIRQRDSSCHTHPWINVTSNKSNNIGKWIWHISDFKEHWRIISL